MTDKKNKPPEDWSKMDLSTFLTSFLGGVGKAITISLSGIEVIRSRVGPIDGQWEAWVDDECLGLFDDKEKALKAVDTYAAKLILLRYIRNNPDDFDIEEGSCDDCPFKDDCPESDSK